jgi:hypothetical protein
MFDRIILLAELYNSHHLDWHCQVLQLVFSTQVPSISLPLLCIWKYQGNKKYCSPTISIQYLLISLGPTRETNCFFLINLRKQIPFSLGAFSVAL